MNSGYQEYLKSPHWQEKRLQVLESGNRECARCHSQVDLAVHHKTYKNIGNEKEVDLIVLCEVCHTKYHNEAKYPFKFGEIFSSEKVRKEKEGLVHIGEAISEAIRL